MSIRVRLFRNTHHLKSNVMLSIPVLPIHGFGRINGTTKKIGNIFPRVQVAVYQRETGNKIWHTFSDKNGQYSIRNLATGLECFVVAIDPNRKYNAVISDGVVAK